MRVYVYSSLLLFFLGACSESNDPKTLFDQGKYEKSLAQWSRLANKGDALAQNYVGIQYYLGLGTQRNFKQAKEWFEKSAKQGVADAQYNLGAMYENGEYVEKDYTNAAMWYSLAIEQGNGRAEKRMQSILDEHRLFPNQYRRAHELAEQYR